MSPRAYADTFAVLDDVTVADLDLTGSGGEAVAGRIRGLRVDRGGNGPRFGPRTALA